MTTQRILCVPVVRTLRVYTAAGRVVIGVLEQRAGGAEVEMARLELEVSEADVLACKLHDAVTAVMEERAKREADEL